MAAINLRDAPIPTVYTFSAETTWQEVQLPPRCRVTVQIKGAGGYLAFKANGDPASPETPSDGGAVGTHRVSITQDSLTTYRSAPITSYRTGQSVFIASQSGTRTAEVVLESLES